MNTRISEELINLIRKEIVQRREEGCDVEAIEGSVERALGRSNGLQEVELHNILRELESLQPVESFPYVEPSTLDEIRAERPDGPPRRAAPYEIKSHRCSVARPHPWGMVRASCWLRLGETCGGLVKR